jgi:hypothetical protein
VTISDIGYVVRPDDAEAVSYAIQFITALSPEGLSAGTYMSNTDLPLNFQGLALCVKEPSDIPEPTIAIAQALQDAGLTCRFARIDELKLGIWAAQEHRITLAIGSKPSRTR